MRCFFLLFMVFLASFPQFAPAQGNKPWSGFGIESNYSAGKIFKHTRKIKAGIPPSSSSFEINFIQQTYGRKSWQQRSRYPLVGFGITYTNYGWDSIYGKCISIYPNLQIPIIRYKDFEWTFRAAFGLGYATRHYSRVGGWDTLNTAVASHLNNYTSFATDLRYRVNKNLDVQIGANFSHISNATLRQPNLGINMYGVHAGLRYFPATSQPDRIMRKLSPLKNRWLVQARIGIAGTEQGFADGPMSPVYLASAYASKRYLSKNKAFAGIDYSYHQNMYVFLRNNEILPGEEKANSWTSAVFAGNEFLIGRVGIIMQVGYYLKQTYIKRDKTYQKIGAQFYLVQHEKGILKELAAAIILKTHKVDAELAEVGIAAGF